MIFCDYAYDVVPYSLSLWQRLSAIKAELELEFGGLHCFQHCSGHIMTGSFVGGGNQYIQLVKVLFCALPTTGKQLPTFPHKVWGLNSRPQRWEACVISPLLIISYLHTQRHLTSQTRALGDHTPLPTNVILNKWKKIPIFFVFVTLS